MLAVCSRNRSTVDLLKYDTVPTHFYQGQESVAVESRYSTDTPYLLHQEMERNVVAV